MNDSIYRRDEQESSRGRVPASAVKRNREPNGRFIACTTQNQVEKLCARGYCANNLHKWIIAVRSAVNY